MPTEYDSRASTTALVLATLQSLLTAIFLIFYYHIFFYLHASWSLFEWILVGLYAACTFPSGLIWMAIYFGSLDSRNILAICAVAGAIAVISNGAFWFICFRNAGRKLLLWREGRGRSISQCEPDIS